VLCAIHRRRGFGGQGAPSRCAPWPIRVTPPSVIGPRQSRHKSCPPRELSSLAGGAAFPSRPENMRTAARSEGTGRSGATRYHAQRVVARAWRALDLSRSEHRGMLHSVRRERGEDGMKSVCRLPMRRSFVKAADRQVAGCCWATPVSLFQIRRQHLFDPFHECADAARQIASMCHDEGHGERAATKIGCDLHERSTL
jgi:hypothetical protein